MKAYKKKNRKTILNIGGVQSKTIVRSSARGQFGCRVKKSGLILDMLTSGIHLSLGVVFVMKPPKK